MPLLTSSLFVLRGPFAIDRTLISNYQLLFLCLSSAPPAPFLLLPPSPSFSRSATTAATFSILLPSFSTTLPPSQLGTADAGMKDPSFENPELNGPLLKAWSRSVCSHAMPTFRDFFLANFNRLGLFTCIFFPKTPPEIFLC